MPTNLSSPAPPARNEVPPVTPVAKPAAQAQRSKGLQAIVFSMAGRIGVIAINMATGIITARVLHPTGRGEQAAIMLWPVLLSNAMTLGLPSAVTYYTRKHRAALPQLTGIAILMAALVGFAAALVAYLLMPVLLAQYSGSVIIYARCLLLTVPVGVVALVARTVLEAEGKFHISIQAQWFSPAITLIALLVLWLSGLMTPFNSAAAYTFSVFPVAIWLFWCLFQTTSLSLDKAANHARLLLSYGLRSYGIDLCSTLAAYVDQALVVSILAPREMGIYVVALSVSRMLNFCQASVVMVLLPKASALPPSEVMSVTGRAARFSFLATGLCAVCCAVFGPAAIRILYGAGFNEAIPVFRVLLAEVTIAGTVMVLAQAPMALGRPGITTILQVLGLVLTIPLMLFFVPRYGILGAAIALLITTTMRLILILAAFPMALKLPSPRLWMDRADYTQLLTRSKLVSQRLFASSFSGLLP